MSRAAYHVATTFGLGDILPAPGTSAGSAPAAAVWLVAAWFFGSSPWFVVGAWTAVTAAVIAGLWAAEAEVVRRGLADPGPVVVDEVAGQWLALGAAWPLWAGGDGRQLVIFVAAAFFIFRLFDIVKPWPVRRLEALPGGIGVMADDLAAGLMSGIVLALAFRPLAGL